MAEDSLKECNAMVLHVTVVGIRDLYQTGIGAHVTQFSRSGLPDILSGYPALDPVWKTLGLSPSMYTWERFAFAYLAQCRCGPANTMIYFANLNTIVATMLNLQIDPPSELQRLIIEERERCLFTPEDYTRAVHDLGLGCDGDLGVELDSDVDNDFIAQAWRTCTVQDSVNLPSHLFADHLTASCHAAATTCL